MIAPVRQTAPAKLNLTLTILGRRADGYHELVSLVAFAQDVADTVTLAPGSTQNVLFSGPFSSGLHAGDSTTISETLRLLAQSPLSSPDLRLGAVAVEKNIPLASGLGGGSADAAALLRAVKYSNPMLAHHKLDWQIIARQVGADVPVCLASRAQMMSGVGETLEPVSAFPNLHAVLIKTDAPSPPDKTQWVFAVLDAKPLAELGRQEPNQDKGAFDCAQDVAAFVRKTGNTLLDPARMLMPSLTAPLAALDAQPGCLAVSLTGAGPTVFGLYEDRAMADASAVEIQAAEPAWWVKVSALV